MNSELYSKNQETLQVLTRRLDLSQTVRFLVEFGAKNGRKSGTYKSYVSILRVFFPPKSTKYARLHLLSEVITKIIQS